MSARTPTSRCDICDGSIIYSPVLAGMGPEPAERSWKHLNRSDWVDNIHEVVPEVRFAIDATCPGCDFPEIGYVPAREEFVCSRCGHTSKERPAS